MKFSATFSRPIGDGDVVILDHEIQGLQAAVVKTLHKPTVRRSGNQLSVDGGMLGNAARARAQISLSLMPHKMTCTVTCRLAYGLLFWIWPIALVATVPAAFLLDPKGVWAWAVLGLRVIVIAFGLYYLVQAHRSMPRLKSALLIVLERTIAGRDVSHRRSAPDTPGLSTL